MYMCVYVYIFYFQNGFSNILFFFSFSYITECVINYIQRGSPSISDSILLQKRIVKFTTYLIYVKLINYLIYY